MEVRMSSLLLLLWLRRNEHWLDSLQPARMPVGFSLPVCCFSGRFLLSKMCIWRWSRGFFYTRYTNSCKIANRNDHYVIFQQKCDALGLVNGEVWRPSEDDCFICGCMASFVMCSYHVCPPLTCENPIMIAGRYFCCINNAALLTIL